jgi:hypothetical protein
VTSQRLCHTCTDQPSVDPLQTALKTGSYTSDLTIPVATGQAGNYTHMAIQRDGTSCKDGDRWTENL